MTAPPTHEDVGQRLANTTPKGTFWQVRMDHASHRRRVVGRPEDLRSLRRAEHIRAANPSICPCLHGQPKKSSWRKISFFRTMPWTSLKIKETGLGLCCHLGKHRGLRRLQRQLLNGILQAERPTTTQLDATMGSAMPSKATSEQQASPFQKPALRQ